MKKRNLDGIFFRMKRDDAYDNICFTDLTDEEINEISSDRSKEWWMSVAMHLRERIRDIGEQLDIVGGHPNV